MDDTRIRANRARRTLSRFVRRVLLVLGVVAGALFVWELSSVLLLAFAGLLLAVFLRGLAERLAAHTPFSENAALALVVVLLVASFAGMFWLVGPRLADEVTQATRQAPELVQSLQDQLRQYPWGEYVIQHVQGPESLLTRSIDIFGRITGVASSMLSALTNLIVFLLVGLFFAAEPALYKNGIVKLLPPHRRERAREVLDVTGRALWGWLMGRLFSMVLVGILTWLGLQIIGVPLSLVLGIIAALFDFVPNFGPFVAALPGVLIAWTISPSRALYAALMYLAIQQLEGNVLTPLIQERIVSLPPVVTVVATVGFGLVFGLAGVMLGTPLALVGLIWVKMLYVEDVLGDRTHVPGRDSGHKR